MAESTDKDNKKAVVNPAAKPNNAKNGVREGRRPFRGKGGPRGPKRDAGPDSEFEQQILDLARVTRVMAGGKRMRFRACVGLGNKAGRVGIGLAKGADVTMAITKAVNQAKKRMIDVPLTNVASIPHEITYRFGASQIKLRPAKVGRGIICGGVVRRIAELAGLQNVTGKILGTNNNVTNAKCTIKALAALKPLKIKKSVKAENAEAAPKQ